MIEKYVTPILGKIITLMSNKQKLGVGQPLTAPRVNEKLMEISGELVHQIKTEMHDCFDHSVANVLYRTVCDFYTEQVTQGLTQSQSFATTAETTYVTFTEDATPEQTPRAAPAPLSPLLLKHFVFNLPALALDLPSGEFKTYILPLIIKLSEYSDTLTA